MKMNQNTSYMIMYRSIVIRPDRHSQMANLSLSILSVTMEQIPVRQDQSNKVYSITN